MGLLVLRATVGMTSAIQGGAYLSDLVDPTVATWSLGLLAIVSGAGVVVGFLTPGTGLLAGLATTFIVVSWNPPPSSFVIDSVGTAFVMADAVALVLLGPGAHSMDAYLFGRREIIIPRQSHSH